jgi:hypothetical protein
MPDYVPLGAPRMIFGQYPESLDKNVLILAKILYYSLTAKPAVPLLAGSLLIENGAACR